MPAVKNFVGSWRGESADVNEADGLRLRPERATTRQLQSSAEDKEEREADTKNRGRAKEPETGPFIPP
jgi:hypothetical protein